MSDGVQRKKLSQTTC